MQLGKLFFDALREYLLHGFFKKRSRLLALGLGLLLFQSCAMLQQPPDTVPPAPEKPATTPTPAPAPKSGAAPQAQLPQTGEASWYGQQHAGKLTANGELFDPAALTAAHRTLAFGSKVKVTNLTNGKTVEVRINDRGPAANNRIIDLSQAAAKALELTEPGKAPVRLEPSSSE